MISLAAAGALEALFINFTQLNPDGVGILHTKFLLADDSGLAPCSLLNNKILHCINYFLFCYDSVLRRLCEHGLAVVDAGELCADCAPVPLW